MKKGNVEVIIHDVNKEGFTGYTFYIKRGFLFHVEDNEYLKDLRSLIDTVLGEEIDNGTTTEYVDNFEKGSFSQPLTEGEEKCGLTERECRLLGGNCYDEPQESNKEEEFDTEWMKGKSLQLVQELQPREIWCPTCNNEYVPFKTISPDKGFSLCTQDESASRDYQDPRTFKQWRPALSNT